MFIQTQWSAPWTHWQDVIIYHTFFLSFSISLLKRTSYMQTFSWSLNKNPFGFSTGYLRSTHSYLQCLLSLVSFFCCVFFSNFTKPCYCCCFTAIHATLHIIKCFATMNSWSIPPNLGMCCMDFVFQCCEGDLQLKKGKQESNHRWT